MVKKIIYLFFVGMCIAVILRVIFPPPMAFEIYEAPKSIYTFGIVRYPDSSIQEWRNTYIVKGTKHLSSKVLKQRLDSFTCKVTPSSFEGKGTYWVSFYKFSRRTTDEKLSGPDLYDITYIASEDHLMSYSFNHEGYIWLHVNEDLMAGIHGGILDRGMDCPD